MVRARRRVPRSIRSAALAAALPCRCRLSRPRRVQQQRSPSSGLESEGWSRSGRVGPQQLNTGPGPGRVGAQLHQRRYRPGSGRVGAHVELWPGPGRVCQHQRRYRPGPGRVTERRQLPQQRQILSAPRGVCLRHRPGTGRVAATRPGQVAAPGPGRVAASGPGRVATARAGWIAASCVHDAFFLISR